MINLDLLIMDELSNDKTSDILYGAKMIALENDDLVDYSIFCDLEKIALGMFYGDICPCIIARDIDII